MRVFEFKALVFAGARSILTLASASMIAAASVGTANAGLLDGPTAVSSVDYSAAATLSGPDTLVWAGPPIPFDAGDLYTAPISAISFRLGGGLSVAWLKRTEETPVRIAEGFGWAFLPVLGFPTLVATGLIGMAVTLRRRQTNRRLASRHRTRVSRSQKELDPWARAGDRSRTFFQRTWRR